MVLYDGVTRPTIELKLLYRVLISRNSILKEHETKVILDNNNNNNKNMKLKVNHLSHVLIFVFARYMKKQRTATCTNVKIIFMTDTIMRQAKYTYNIYCVLNVCYSIVVKCLHPRSEITTVILSTSRY